MSAFKGAVKRTLTEEHRNKVLIFLKHKEEKIKLFETEVENPRFYDIELERSWYGITREVQTFNKDSMNNWLGYGLCVSYWLDIEESEYNFVQKTKHMEALEQVSDLLKSGLELYLTPTQSAALDVVINTPEEELHEL